MEISDFKLNEITLEKLELIKKQWVEKLDFLKDDDLYDIAFSSFDRLLVWINKSISESNCGTCGFFVIQRAANDDYLAIVEMPDARKAKDPSFKLLNISLNPSLNLEFKVTETAADMKYTVGVILAAITLSASHALMNGSKFKIYGRSDGLLLAFEAALVTNEVTSKLFNVYKQSNWLVIEPK